MVIQNILRFLNAKAEIPRYMGVFHLFWILLTVAVTLTLCVLWKKGIIRNTKRTILVSSVILIVLGLYKQIVLNVGYDPVLAFNFDFNNFPWDFASVPLCIGLFVGLTDGNVNKHFTSYLPVFGLLAGVVGMLSPFTFVETIGLNVYTMLCSGWMIAISVFLFYTKQVEPEIKTFWKGFPVLCMVVSLAITFNEVTHWLIPSHPVVNMFSISRLAESDVPVYSWIHNAFLASGGKFTILEYIISVLLYLLVVSAGAICVLLVIMLIKKLSTTDFDAEYKESDTVASSKARVSKREQELLNKIEALEKKVKDKSNNPFMAHYFKNLRVNFGDNLKGSCGYVALAMILAYFDTVLNDRIVPENYDQTSNDYNVSPGTRKDIPNADINTWNYDQYKAFIDQKKNFYLHAKLLDIVDKQGRVKFMKNDFNFGSTANDIKAVLEDYLKYVANISPKYCTTSEPMIRANDKYINATKIIENSLYIIDKDDRVVYDPSRRIKTYVKDDLYDQCFRSIQLASDEIKKFTIDTIRNKGVPVWLSVGRLTDTIHPGDKTRNVLMVEGGHAIVAYAVTDNDEILCHYGWPTVISELESPYYENDNQYTCKLAMSGDVDGKYNLYTGAVAIEFPNMPHVHTNNYEIKIGGKVYYYCPDGTHSNAKGEIVVSNGNYLISLHDKDSCSIEGYKGNIITKDNIFKIPNKFDPYEVIAIADDAFNNQSFIKTLIVPKDICSIGDRAFSRCRSLEHVVLTDDVKFIGEGAFADCSSLVAIEFDGTIEKWQRIRKGKGWNARTGNYTIYCKNGEIQKANNAFNTIFN